MLKPDKNEYHKTSLDFNELKFMLFGKKKCPKCNEKLMRDDIKKWTGKGDKYIGDGSSGTTFKNVEQYEVKIAYKCEKCNKNYTISELTEKIKK
jgi:ssDNA-binding Zn-finger/Zn-ribbon topoisomerase 1